MPSQSNLNLKSFPIIKIVSASLFFGGGILAYILSSKPEFMLFQLGGIPLNLILGIFPLLSGIFLFIYAFLTNNTLSFSMKDDILKIKSRKKEISVKKEDIQAVRVRDAGKFWIWFVFIFVNYFFMYLGVECSLYFSANHNAGLLEFVLIAFLMVWSANVLLIFFPRKIIGIFTKDKIIAQKVNYLPKNESFEKFFDGVFDVGTLDASSTLKTKSDQYLYRLVLGLIFLIILILTSILVEIDGIVQPLHDLGIFIPIFMLLFSVLMAASAIQIGREQNIMLADKIVRIEEKTIITPITGKNICWIKPKEKLEANQFYKRGFKKLTKYDLLLIFVIFGQALYLAFKFIWIPSVYLNYLDGRDVIIGILMLCVLFFYQFEILTKIDKNVNPDVMFRRAIILINPENISSVAGLKPKTKSYFKDFKSLLKTDFKKQLVRIAIAYTAALLVITLSITLLGFIIFIYI